MRYRNAIASLLASAVVLSLAPTTTASAQAAALSPQHPTRYIVQRGDTLWDISGTFLAEPWRWPEVWEANPQVENPHLIYPGDEIMLIETAGGPRLRVRRRGGRPTVKLSPTVRSVVLDRAIPTIPLDAINQFLLRPRVVTESLLADAPYIVSVGREALIAREGTKFYARGIENDAETRFTVFRRGQQYRRVGSDEVLGLEALHVGDAVLHASGDPATLWLTANKREVLTGDRLLSLQEEEIEYHFMPRAPDRELSGQIIAVIDGVSQIGQHHVVVLDLGTADGIEAGHVMAVYQRGDTIVDQLAADPDANKDKTAGRKHLELDPEKQGGFEGWVQSADDFVVNLTRPLRDLSAQIEAEPGEYQLVKLPDERAGTVMVFRPFERVSYALVMEASRAIHLNDTLRNP